MTPQKSAESDVKDWDKLETVHGIFLRVKSRLLSGVSSQM
jgi:hypothetical protein